MIILRIKGGLGNQMFQYAFCRSLADKYNQQIWIDFSEFRNSNRTYSLDLFPLSAVILNELDSIGIRHSNSYILQEQDFGYDQQALGAFEGYDLNNSIFLVSGFWQSYKYFSPISPLIRNDFRNTYPIDPKYNDLNCAILNTESVMVHVRRGDYLHSGNLEKHGVVDINYIETGMDFYRRKLLNPQFFIFSDDPLWCISNIPKRDDVIYIDPDADDGKTSFSLMRRCKYFLISNSTFSWWAAWLAEYPEKHVIYPRNWFRQDNIDSSDLAPPTWERY